jgi:hypothetical protein
MMVKDLVDKFDLAVTAGESGLDREVTDGYCGDKLRMMKPSKKQIRKAFPFCCGQILHIVWPVAFLAPASGIL